MKKYQHLSPQEKKQLSYQKDRRNAYGENDKASRKAIRFRKRWVNQTYRNTIKRFVGELTKLTELPGEIIESKIKSAKRKSWKKAPDISLTEHIEIQQHKRVKLRNRRKKQEKS